MPSPSTVAIVVALVIGALLPLQALINAQLGRATSGALFASFVSFLTGTLVLGVVMLAARTPWPGPTTLSAVPGWAWVGGSIGAVYVVSATVLVPRLGAGALICLVVLGQILASLALDHYGVLVAPRPADALRLAGAGLVLLGVLLVVQPWASR